MIMKKSDLPSIRAQNELRKLGADIAAARKKRSLTQARLAEGAGINVSTVRRLEFGDHGISLGVLAMVLTVLGEPSRLGRLIDAAQDDVGLMLGDRKLPQRVRSHSGRPAASRQAVSTPIAQPVATTDDDGVAF